MKLERSAGDIPSVPPQSWLELYKLAAFFASAMTAMTMLETWSERRRLRLCQDTCLRSQRSRPVSLLTTKDGVYVPGIGYMGWSPTQTCYPIWWRAPVIGAYMLPGNKAFVSRLAAKAKDKAVERVMEISVSRLRLSDSFFEEAYNHRFVKHSIRRSRLSEEAYAVSRQV